MGLLDLLFGPKVDLKKLIQEGAMIVDVRTKGEFASGHVKGSQSIPLDTIAQNIERIKKQGKPVVACCRSGNRSRMAISAMKKAGIEAYNGGSWQNVDRLKG